MNVQFPKKKANDYEICEKKTIPTSFVRSAG